MEPASLKAPSTKYLTFDASIDEVLTEPNDRVFLSQLLSHWFNGEEFTLTSSPILGGYEITIKLKQIIQRTLYFNNWREFSFPKEIRFELTNGRIKFKPDYRPYEQWSTYTRTYVETWLSIDFLNEECLITSDISSGFLILCVHSDNSRKLSKTALLNLFTSPCERLHQIVDTCVTENAQAGMKRFFDVFQKNIKSIDIDSSEMEVKVFVLLSVNTSIDLHFNSREACAYFNVQMQFYINKKGLILFEEFRPREYMKFNGKVYPLMHREWKMLSFDNDQSRIYYNSHTYGVPDTETFDNKDLVDIRRLV